MGKGASNDAKDMSVFGGDHGIEKPAVDGDFIWSMAEEPHLSRRKAIIKAHPEIKKLYGHEWKTKYIVTGLVALQCFCAYQLRDMAWTWQFFVTAYVVGATATQALFLAIHETSHFLAFKKPSHNKMFNIFANLPIALPYSAAFRGYHMEHHMHQGVDGIDTDVPTKLEGLLFTNVLGKLFFCINQILFYAIRPMVVRKQAFSSWHAANWIVQFSFDALVYSLFGTGPLFYFLMSDYLAGSLHPVASHFIAEHYVFVGKEETYSYYGWLNIFCFNVGYHNEHHDFPNIAWSNLPKLRRIAPEFYENLPQHKSWPLVIYKFITDPNVGAFNRVKRPDTEKFGERYPVCGGNAANPDKKD